MNKEGDPYGKLHKYGVPAIATFVRGRDLGQKTMTYEMRTCETKVLKPHQHYRMVLREGRGEPDFFRVVKGVLTVIRDAVEGTVPPQLH